MIIRDGFVTNSSSTNFLIISKEELTEEYLLNKLGFKHNSLIRVAGERLVESIFSGIQSGLRWYDFDTHNPTYDEVLKVFGVESADKFRELTKRGHKTYMGYTNSDDGGLSTFLTTDYFLIDDRDFYFDGRNSSW
jgi:hypothetical protein